MNRIKLIRNKNENDNYSKVFDYCYFKFYNDLKRDKLLITTNKNIFSYSGVEYYVYINDQEEMIQEIIIDEALFSFIILSTNDNH